MALNPGPFPSIVRLVRPLLLLTSACLPNLPQYSTNYVVVSSRYHRHGYTHETRAGGGSLVFAMGAAVPLLPRPLRSASPSAPLLPRPEGGGAVCGTYGQVLRLRGQRQQVLPPVLLWSRVRWAILCGHGDCRWRQPDSPSPGGRGPPSQRAGGARQVVRGDWRREMESKRRVARGRH